MSPLKSSPKASPTSEPSPPSLEENAIAQLTQTFTTALDGISVRLNLLPTRTQPIGIGPYLGHTPATATHSAQYIAGLRFNAIVTLTVATEDLLPQVPQRLLTQRTNLRLAGLLSWQLSDPLSTSSTTLIYQVLYEFIAQTSPTEGIIREIVINS